MDFFFSGWLKKKKNESSRYRGSRGREKRAEAHASGRQAGSSCIDWPACQPRARPFGCRVGNATDKLELQLYSSRESDPRARDEGINLSLADELLSIGPLKRRERVFTTP